VGAHAIAFDRPRRRSIGWITSSHMGAGVGRPVALAMIEDGAKRHGEIMEFEHFGSSFRGKLVPPCHFDPAGERLSV
jgi:sarcosine oxidase subunit alpha